MIAKPLGFVNPPIWLGPSSSHSEAVVTVARCLPLATLCSLAMVESCSNIGAMIVVVEGEAPNVSEDEAAAALEDEMDSPSTIDPSLMGTAVYDVGGSALVPHDEDVIPSGDHLIWPHPMDPVRLYSW